MTRKATIKDQIYFLYKFTAENVIRQDNLAGKSVKSARDNAIGLLTNCIKNNHKRAYNNTPEMYNEVITQTVQEILDRVYGKTRISSVQDRIDGTFAVNTGIPMF